MGWLTDFKDWLVDQWKALWGAFFDFGNDLILKFLKKALELFAELAKDIPVPPWMADYSLGHLFAQLSPTLGYFVDRLGFGVGLGLIGLGYAFRVVRKLATAFQW